MSANFSALISAGHDVTHMLDLDRSAPDDAVLELAFAEDRTLISYDFGFGDQIVRDKASNAGVVIVGDISDVVERLNMIVRLVAEYGDKLTGNLTIVDLHKTRTRPAR